MPEEKKERAKPEIIEHIATFREYTNGWTKELNIVSWNGNDPVYDIRSWSMYHNNFGRGVSFTPDEWEILAGVFEDY